MDSIENDTSNNYSIVAYVFVAAVTFLPSRCLTTIGGVYIQTYRLMGGIYEIRRWDGLRCHDINTKFHKDWFTHSKVDMGDIFPSPRRYSSVWALVSWVISLHFFLFFTRSDDEASNGRMKKWEECGWQSSWPTYFLWFSIHPRLIIWFLNNLVFTVWGC
jgi:hypothetical protein